MTEEEQRDQSNKEEAKTNEENNAMAPNESNEASKEGEEKVSLTNKNKDATVELGTDEVIISGPPPEQRYPALTKAELQKYADDPSWVRLRWALFILFWLAWVGMLVAAVAIIVVAPKCPAPEPKEWWQKKPVYEVYVKSFKDSNGDGIGDLKGVESKVSYLKSLMIGSVWLNPIQSLSDKNDETYSISNYVELDPEIGTLDDMKDLVNVLYDNDIKVIIDFVPNHSSDQHEWFQKSVKQEEPYKDYYIWKQGTRSRPPTNAKAVNGESAWEYNADRGAWYFHQYSKDQPDLNLRNPKVIDEMKKVLNFWMDQGVDGFRIINADRLVEDNSQISNMNDNLELLKTFRKVLDNKTAEDEYKPRIMMTETGVGLDDLMQFYGSEFETHSGDIAHLPLYNAFIDKFQKEPDASPGNMDYVIKEYTEALPGNGSAWPNFITSNANKPRLASRVGHALVDAFAMVQMLMPGTPITYYGEEIGMMDNDRIPSRKNRGRSPMQWDGTANAGFTSGQPWLAVNSDYTTINVQDQLEADYSHLQVYQQLAHIREHQSILFGSYDSLVNGTLFAFNRVKRGNPGYLCAINFGTKPIKADVSNLPFLPESGNVHVRSFHRMSEDGVEEGKDSDPEALWSKVFFDDIYLKAKEGVVVTFVPKT